MYLPRPANPLLHLDKVAALQSTHVHFEMLRLVPSIRTAYTTSQRLVMHFEGTEDQDKGWRQTTSVSPHFVNSPAHRD